MIQSSKVTPLRPQGSASKNPKSDGSSIRALTRGTKAYRPVSPHGIRNAERLRAAWAEVKKARPISKAEFARRTGKSPNTADAYFNGRAEITDIVMLEWANYLDLMPQAIWPDSWRFAHMTRGSHAPSSYALLKKFDQLGTDMRRRLIDLLDHTLNLRSEKLPDRLAPNTSLEA